jgi:hypothetical protein
MTNENLGWFLKKPLGFEILQCGIFEKLNAEC